MNPAYVATLKAVPRWRGWLGAAVAVSALGCYGATGGAPSSTPAKNPLDDAPPSGPAEVHPQSAEEVATRKNKFDDEQAKIVLGRAAASARTCVDVVDKDQPHGDANVTVTFTGAGRSTAATVTPPFDGTPMGQCVTRAFVNVIVPPFDGPDVEVPVTVTLKPSDKKEAAPAKGKKK
jgi:hypothetical protein